MMIFLLVILFQSCIDYNYVIRDPFNFQWLSTRWILISTSITIIP